MLCDEEKMEQLQPLVDALFDLAGRRLPTSCRNYWRPLDLQLLDVADNPLGDAGVSALPPRGGQPGRGVLRFLGLAKNASATTAAG